MVKHSPSYITVVSASDGAFLWQNPASMAAFGAHGHFNTTTSGLTTAPYGSAAITFGSKLNFIEMIFYNDEAGRESMLACVQLCAPFSGRNPSPPASADDEVGGRCGGAPRRPDYALQGPCHNGRDARRGTGEFVESMILSHLSLTHLIALLRST